MQLLEIIQALKMLLALGFTLYLIPEDIRCHRIKNRNLIIGACTLLVITALEIVLHFITPTQEIYFVPNLFAALLLGGFLLIANLLSKNGVGMGDVKLVALLSAYFTPAVSFIGLLIAMLISAIYGIIMISAGKKTRKHAVAFVPFLALGYLISILLMFGGII
jgi:leader peptidase (prepilin peptidase)/N-methyltransferase